MTGSAQAHATFGKNKFDYASVRNTKRKYQSTNTFPQNSSFSATTIQLCTVIFECESTYSLNVVLAG